MGGEEKNSKKSREEASISNISEGQLQSPKGRGDRSRGVPGPLGAEIHAGDPKTTGIYLCVLSLDRITV